MPGSKPRRTRNIPSRWSAFGSSGSGRPFRWRSSAAAARSSSVASCSPSCASRSAAMIVGRDALRPELRLERHPSPRRVSVALLDPPPRESLVVHEPDSLQALQGGGHHFVARPGTAEPLLHLPPRARPRPEEAARDLERLLGVGRRARLAGRASGLPRRGHPVRPGSRTPGRRLRLGRGPVVADGDGRHAAADLVLDRIGQARVGLQELARRFASVPQPGVAVVEPGTGLGQDARRDPDVQEAALAADALVVEDVELGDPERRRRPCSSRP